MIKHDQRTSSQFIKRAARVGLIQYLLTYFKENRIINTIASPSEFTPREPSYNV